MDKNKTNESLFAECENKLEEAYEDSFWRLVMKRYAQKEGEILMEQNEEIKNDPRYAPSAEATKRFFKMSNKYFRKKKLVRLANNAKKILKAAAMVVLAFVAVFALAFVSVEAFRVRVLNFFVTFENEYTSVKLVGDDYNRAITSGLSETYAPTYMPEGYKLDSVSDMATVKTIEYANEEGQKIAFHVFGPYGTYNIDSEDAEIKKTVKINGAEGIYIFKKGKSTVSWSYDDKIFVIFAQISEDEIMQIAESVIFVK
ncbi:MAG: DUF4367 domain-containing protein [Oscillospiraceae bacterium]|nr:DUF4367 domain-containing protein [Oscillospiraceae bacterium]